MLPCKDIEDTWVQIRCRKLPSVLIGVIYRHPKCTNDSYEYISHVFHLACLKKKSLIIVGDMNNDLLICGLKLSQIIHITGLSQLINNPTRVTENSKTLLDVFITNNPNIIVSTVVVKSHLSDHDMLVGTINLSKPKREPVIKTFSSLTNCTKERFCRYLLSCVSSLTQILNTDNVNIQACILTGIFNECLDECAPIVT